jgi:hypothetical protein
MRPICLRPLGTIVSVLTLCTALLVPATAGADVSSVYPPEPEARSFATGSGGWTGSTSFESCPLPATCPTVENTFEAAGGAGGEGYLHSSFKATLTIVGTATAAWQSPPFLYTDAEAEAPTSLSLGLSRRADVEDLLSVSGSSATYSVDLVDVTEGGAVLPAAGPLDLEGAGDWTAVPTFLDPAALVLGHTYAIRISSRYVPGTVSLLVEGGADFDDVVLAATRPDDPPATPPPGGGNGDDNADGDGGGSAATKGSLTTGELLSSVRLSSQETAEVRGNGSRVFVRVSCPRRVQRACRITAQGMIGKRSRVTRRRAVRVASGRARLVGLPVKPRFRDSVAARKRLLIVQKVRVGKVSTTFVRSRVLIRRG